MSNNLRIGLVCPYDIYTDGGVQFVIKQLYDFLSKKGHYVKILTPMPVSTVKKKSSIDKDIIFIGKSRDFRSPLHTTVQISSSADDKEIKDILKKEKFDVINFHEPWVPFISRQILSHSTSINIGTFHAKIPDTKFIKGFVKSLNLYLKSVAKNLDGFTAVSNTAAEHINTLTDREIKIIPNFINLSEYQNIKKSPKTDTKKILFIGRLETRKGVKYLLDAFHILSKKYDNLELLIAGDGPKRKILEELTKDLNLQNVSFLGKISSNKKVNLFGSADLFCSPAIFGESFGIVLLEAMASGLPIVCGDNPGYKELMKDVGVFSVVDVRNSIDFANRLELLLFNNDLIKIFKIWEENYVMKFDQDIILSQYEKYFVNFK